MNEYGEMGKFLAVGLAGLGMAGAGVGLGILGSGAMNALGRNPGGPGRDRAEHDPGAGVHGGHRHLRPRGGHPAHLRCVSGAA